MRLGAAACASTLASCGVLLLLAESRWRPSVGLVAPIRGGAVVSRGREFFGGRRPTLARAAKARLLVEQRAVYAKSQLAGWRYTLLICLVAAWAIRRLMLARAGPWGTGGAVGAGAAACLLIARRFRLKPVTPETLAYGLFEGQTAALFSRLPDALDALRGRLQDEAGLSLAAADSIPDKVAALRRLFDLSSGQRKPYSEARAALEGASSPTWGASAQVLQEGARLLAFAEAPYEAHDVVRHACEERGHQLIQWQAQSSPGSPAYFLSFNSAEKEAILSVRGTQTPADALTDLVNNVQVHEYDNGKKLFAHEGFFVGAQSICTKVLPTVQQLLAPLQYSLVVTGHSLGASTAALITVLLRDAQSSWSRKIPVRCVCFAPCPCLDFANAMRCCESAAPLLKPFVTSFVCNDDGVARVSMQNLGRLSLLSKGAQIDDVLRLASKQEFRAAEGREIDLLVPGKVVMLHRVAEAERAVGEEAPKSAAPKQREEEALKPPAKWKAFAGDCTSFPELSYLEPSPSSINDHIGGPT